MAGVGCGWRDMRLSVLTTRTKLVFVTFASIVFSVVAFSSVYPDDMVISRLTQPRARKLCAVARFVVCA